MKNTIPPTDVAGAVTIGRTNYSPPAIWPHSKMHQRPISAAVLAGFALLLFFPRLARAQFSSVPLSSYEGQNVSSIEFAGRPDLDTAKYMPMVEQKAGEPFSVEQINNSVAALRASKDFQGVKLELLPEPDGVRVLFVLEPALYIGIFVFPGANAEFQYTRLLQIANYQTQEPYTADHVHQAQAALSEFYNRNGFFQAEVKPELKIDKAHGLVNVMFNSKLGRRAKLGEIDLEGATPQETAQLKAALRSVMAVLRGTSLKTGKPYTLSRLEHATSYMQSRLGKQGFLTAQVKFVAPDYDPETNRAALKFTIKTGSTVHISVNGEHLWPWSKSKLIPMYSEHSMDEDLIDEGRRDLTSHLQSQGYFDAQVRVDSKSQGDAATVVYEVAKGKHNKVESVTVAGNRHFTEGNLLGHVPVSKKAVYNPFSHGHFSQQLVQTSVDNLLKFYRNSGYSEVKVTSAVKADPKGDLRVTFQVDEGQQDVVTALHIVGNNSVPVDKLTTHGLKLGPGKPYSGLLVRDDRNEVIANYLRKGYLTATFQSKATVDKKKPHNVTVTYQINEGPQVITGDILTEGRGHTKQWLVDKALRLRSGAPLSENDTLASETKLYGLNVFDWASIDPREPVTDEPKAVVLVKLHEAKLNTITYSFGFEIIKRGGSVPGGTVPITPVPTGSALANFTTDEKTFYGPRGSFTYTRNNVLGSAESLSFGGFAGRLDQRGQTTYTIPYLNRTDWQMSSTLSGELNSENPIFSDRTGDISVQFQHALNEKKTKRVFFRYDGRLTVLTTLIIPELVPLDQRRVRLSGPTASFVSDSRDNPLDAHRGFYHSYEIGIDPKELGSNFSFAHFLGQTAYYRQLPFDKIVWASSIRVGIAEPIEGSTVPISESFFSGGGSTLRGFALDAAGPQRPIQVCSQSDSTDCTTINVPGGGKQLLILNTELRIPLPIKPGLGIVGFYDGGNVFGSIGFHGGCGAMEHEEGIFQGCNYTNTVGLGLRYATPIGPLRVDLGYNLDAPPGLTATQYFITLGQAF
jgi:outer membrane protein insertion porin family